MRAGPSQRRVGRLELTAPSPELIRRGALLVEDALRTAVLPPRLLVLRRLELGMIDAARSPAALSARIEEALRHVRAMALRPAATGAAHSPAVVFADELEPLTMLGAALAEGRRPEAWFLRAAVRGYDPAAPAAESLGRVLAAAQASAAGIVGVAQIFDAAAARGRLAVLLEAVSPELATRLAAEAGLDFPAVAASEAAAGGGEGARRRVTASLAALPSGWKPALPAFLTHEGPGPRSFWVAAVALARARPFAASAAGSASEAVALVAHAAEVLATPAPAPRRGTSESVSTRQGDAPAPEERAPIEGRRLPDEEETTEPAASAEVDPAPIAEETGPRFEGKAVDTDFGGFFFLVRALQLGGVDAWLADAAPRDWRAPRQALFLLADRLGVPDTDVVRLALLEEDEDADTARAAGFDDATHHLAEMATAQVSRESELELDELVMRRARIICTATHVDVFMPAREADVRVRLAGLDIDPGWVPWLARVVLFHYLEKGELDAL